MSLVSALKTLLIPRKSSAKTTDLDTDWRAIEVWAQQVVDAIKSISGGGFYASLTGPGETTSPGKLNQVGDFSIDGNLQVFGGTNSFIDGNGALNIDVELLSLNGYNGIAFFRNTSYQSQFSNPGHATGGTVIDSQARALLNGLVDQLVAYGLFGP